jgi:hypothetical protein
MPKELPGFVWLAQWAIEDKEEYIYNNYSCIYFRYSGHKTTKGRYSHKLFLSEETARKYKPKWNKKLLSIAQCTIIPYAQVQILRPILSAKVQADKADKQTKKLRSRKLATK